MAHQIPVVSKPKWSFADLHSSSLAWCILGISALITIAAWYVSHDSVVRSAETRFRFKVQDIQTAITKRMLEQEVALWGGVGLFKASEDVTRNEWAEYVKSLRLNKYLPGLQGYGYSKLVGPDEVEAHENTIRSEGFPGFEISPTGKRDVYSSIVFLEPFTDRNLRAFGFDMWSEPTRRAAMVRARDTGLAAVSAKVVLVQETENDVQRGFLMYLPVYRNGMPTDTLEQRRTAIIGFVYSPFRVEDLMEGIIGNEGTDIGFRIYDGGLRAPGSLLYDSAGTYGPEDEIGKGPFSGKTSLSIGGQPWVLEFRTGAGFISADEAMEPLLVAFGAILIDILLFLTICSMSNQKRRAQVLAAAMVEELSQAKEHAERMAEKETQLREMEQSSNAKLQTANFGLMKFASIVAHDLRAPLKRVEALIEVLREDYDKTLDEDGRDVLTRIERGSSRMRMMLDSMHNYSKCSNVSIEGKSANLAGVVSNAVETYGGIGDVRISNRVGADSWVCGDPILLEHVIQNLIGNSIKFRGTADPTIVVTSTRCDDGKLEISVEDDGIGIEPQYAGKVFEMFTRLHNEDEYEGTGIGLAICKKIIVDHGGDISVDTSAKTGTRIVLSLVLADQEASKVGELEAA